MRRVVSSASPRWRGMSWPDSERPARRFNPAARLSAARHSPEICLRQGEGGPKMGRAAAQSLALTVTESRCVYTAQESTIPAG